MTVELIAIILLAILVLAIMGVALSLEVTIDLLRKHISELERDNQKLNEMLVRSEIAINMDKVSDQMADDLATLLTGFDRDGQPVSPRQMLTDKTPASDWRIIFAKK